MKQFSQLIGIGIVSGAVLAALMQVIYTLTGNEAYVLLYNVDYFQSSMSGRTLPGSVSSFTLFFVLPVSSGFFTYCNFSGGNTECGLISPCIQ